MVNLRKQKGMSLLIAMLILPLILVLGVTVMNKTLLGLKVVGARVVQDESNIMLINASDNLLKRATSAQDFASASDSSTFSHGDVDATVSVEGEVNCKRRLDASGNNFKCKYLQVDFEHRFGRVKSNGKKQALNGLGVGIEQPIIVD